MYRLLWHDKQGFGGVGKALDGANLTFVGQTFPYEEGRKGEGSTYMIIGLGCCQTCKLMYSSLHVLVSIVVRDTCIGIYISRRMKINPKLKEKFGKV